VVTTPITTTGTELPPPGAYRGFQELAKNGAQCDCRWHLSAHPPITTVPWSWLAALAPASRRRVLAPGASFSIDLHIAIS
jgi:hypothetical protein